MDSMDDTNIQIVQTISEAFSLIPQPPNKDDEDETQSWDDGEGIAYTPNYKQLPIAARITPQWREKVLSLVSNKQKIEDSLYCFCSH